MESLMIKYINEINNFKKELEKRHETTSIDLKTKSTYSGLGEVLEITSKFEDSMIIFEEIDPVITYKFNERKTSKKIKLKVDVTDIEKIYYTLDIYECDGKYFYKDYHNNQSELFNTVYELVAFVMNGDECYREPLYTTREDDEKESTRTDYSWRYANEN